MARHLLRPKILIACVAGALCIALFTWRPSLFAPSADTRLEHQTTRPEQQERQPDSQATAANRQDVSPTTAVMVAITNAALAYQGCDDTTFADLMASLSNFDTDPDTRERRQTAERERIINELKASADFEHQHVIALMTQQTDARLQILAQALKTAPNDPMLLWDAVHICSRYKNTNGCQLSEWQSRLEAVDGDNSETWMRIAVNLANEGDMQASLSALRTASAATRSQQFFAQRVARLERGMTAAGGITFSQRVTAAIGYAAASSSPAYGDYMRVCKEGMDVDTAWAYVCADYAATLERQAETLIGASIGIDMQIFAYRFLNDAEQLDATLSRRETIKAHYSPHSNSDVDEIAQTLIGSDPTVFAAYIDSIRTIGEVQTLKTLHADIEKALRENNAPRCSKKAPEQPGLSSAQD